jgi:hypothetical protein
VEQRWLLAIIHQVVIFCCCGGGSSGVTLSEAEECSCNRTLKRGFKQPETHKVNTPIEGGGGGKRYKFFSVKGLVEPYQKWEDLIFFCF